MRSQYAKVGRTGWRYVEEKGISLVENNVLSATPTRYYLFSKCIGNRSPKHSGRAREKVSHVMVCGIYVWTFGLWDFSTFGLLDFWTLGLWDFGTL